MSAPTDADLLPVQPDGDPGSMLPGLDIESAHDIRKQISDELEHFDLAIAEAERGNVSPEAWWKTWVALTTALEAIRREAVKHRSVAIQADVESTVTKLAAYLTPAITAASIATARKLSAEVVDGWKS